MRECKLLSNKLLNLAYWFFSFQNISYLGVFVYFLKGDASDSLAYHNGMKFSTNDRDNDANVAGDSCAESWKGSWWYKNCYHSNLNGRYLGAGKTGGDGIRWDKWQTQSLKKTEMKVRPSHF